MDVYVNFGEVLNYVCDLGIESILSIILSINYIPWIQSCRWFNKPVDVSIDIYGCIKLKIQNLSNDGSV